MCVFVVLLCIYQLNVKKRRPSGALHQKKYTTCIPTPAPTSGSDQEGFHVYAEHQRNAIPGREGR
jgi:hypothetical protein